MYICGGGGWAFIGKYRRAIKYKWLVLLQPTSLWYGPHVLSRHVSLASALAAWRKHPRRMTKAQRRQWIHQESAREIA